MPLSIPDMTIAAQVKPVDVMTPLSNMLNMARGAQAYQQSDQMFPQQLRSATAEADVAQGTAQPRIATSVAQARNAATTADSNAMDFANKKLNAVANRLTGLINNPLIINSEQAPDGVDKTALTGLLQDYGMQQANEMGIPKEQATQLLQPYIDQATKNPAGMRQFLKEKLLATLDSGTRVGAMTPSGIATTNGQQTGVVNTAPLAGPVGAVIPGTSQQLQVPPTATTMVNGQPQYVGPQPPVAAGAGVPIAAGPAVGQVLAAEGPIGTNNAHYSDVVAQGKDAGNRVAQLQSIKEQIPAANMGHGGAGDVWRKLQTIFGSDAATANDIINKNIAMLASSGNTDAARTLQEMQTPNAHVTEKAAQEAADALIGVAKRQQKAVDFFAGTPTNSPAYASKMSQWNSNANPRAFEFALKSPAEQEAMRTQMKKAGTWSTLQKQMIGLHNMGVSPE